MEVHTNCGHRLHYVCTAQNKCHISWVVSALSVLYVRHLQSRRKRIRTETQSDVFRVSSLDSELKAAGEAIAELKRRVQEAETQADELRRDNDALKEKLEQVEQGCIHPSSETENMRREINAKQEVIVNLEKQRNDLEWSLGEHRQWLVDANNR